MAHMPDQVERYGALIQDETGKLGGLVEQVLAFARTSAGAAIRTPQPVRVADLIDRSLETSRAAIERAVITLEKNIPRRIFRS